MDIRAGVIAMILLALIFAYFSLRNGLRALQGARKMTFYRLRRQREGGGWRMLGLALFLVILAIILPVYGLPLAYQYFPPSPTASLTPTITPIPRTTLPPTITLSPTITDTALVTSTPTVTPTPSLPLAVLALFQSSITPNPDAIFSPLTFSTAIDNNLQPINPNTVFENPITEIFATYSYDKMVPGSQWTAIWYRQDGHRQVCVETHPFEGGTGGFDSALCRNPAGGWQPGIYEAQIYVGEALKQSGRFVVEGNPPTPIPSSTPTFTRTPTHTPTPSGTPTSTHTPIPTETPTP